MKFDGYNHIGIQAGVCGGDPTILGTRLKPGQIVRYGSKGEAMEDFDLTMEQVEECHRFSTHVKVRISNRNYPVKPRRMHC